MAVIPVPVAAATPVSAFFIDGWSTTVPTGIAFMGSEAEFTGYYDDPHNLFVQAVDGPIAFSLQVLVPVGQSVGVGTYTNGVGGTILHMRGGNGEWCSKDVQPGTVTITEFAALGDRVTKLAASFSLACGSGTNPPAPVKGIVRLNSTVPFTALRVTPDTIAYPVSHSYGTVSAGASSDAWGGTAENVGTSATSVTASVEGAAYDLAPASCSGSLGVGATCTFGATFEPTTGGTKTGKLHLLTPSLAFSDRAWPLTGTGSASTTTTLTVDTSTIPEWYPSSAYYTTTTNPPGIDGTFEVTVDCDGGFHAVGRSWISRIDTPAGNCTAKSRYADGDGWLPSESSVVSFTMPTRSSIYMNVTSPDLVIEAAPLTFEAVVGPANGATPSTGTVTITDLDNDEVLHTGPISAGDLTVSFTTSDLAPGVRHIRAAYGGGGGIVGNQFDLMFTLEPDAVPPEAGLAVPSFTYETTVPISTFAFEIPVNPVEKMLSNDAVHWASFPFSTTHEWSIIDPATGGFDADGSHTVYAKYRDRAGNWSAVASGTTVLDRGLPVVSETSQSPGTGAALLSSGLPVTVAWSGSDSISGVDHYVLQQSVDGGSFTTLTKVASTSRTVGESGSHSYRFRVVAVDNAGNAKAGASGGSVAVTGVSDRSAAITYRGTWRTASSTAYSGGSAHYATAAGAKATFKVTGRGFSWIASKSKARGSARVYVNGTYVKTVSLYSSTTKHRQLAYSLKWSTSATRTVTIKVLGTSGHPRVDLDAVYSWR